MIVKSKPKKKVEVRKKPGRAPGPRDKELETIHNEVTAQPESKHVEQWVQVPCPYCGEDLEVHVTSDEDGQTMYEDCQVCCRPVSLHVQNEDGELQVEANRS